MSVTPGCAVVNCWGALIIGVGASAVYIFASKNLSRIPCFGVDGSWGTGTMDDVIAAVPVHGCCGIYGTTMVGLFSTPAGYARAYYGDRADKCAGVFYGGNGSALAAQVVFILAVSPRRTGCKHTRK